MSDVSRIAKPIRQQGYQTLFDVSDTLIPLLDPELLQRWTPANQAGGGTGYAATTAGTNAYDTDTTTLC